MRETVTVWLYLVCAALMWNIWTLNTRIEEANERIQQVENVNNKLTTIIINMLELKNVVRFAVEQEGKQ